jgi:hypothetical protein
MTKEMRADILSRLAPNGRIKKGYAKEIATRCNCTERWVALVLKDGKEDNAVVDAAIAVLKEHDQLLRKQKQALQSLQPV